MTDRQGDLKEVLILSKCGKHSTAFCVKKLRDGSG